MLTLSYELRTNLIQLAKFSAVAAMSQAYFKKEHELIAKMWAAAASVFIVHMAVKKPTATTQALTGIALIVGMESIAKQANGSYVTAILCLSTALGIFTHFFTNIDWKD